MDILVNKNSTPILSAVRRMHAEDDRTAPKGADPYNTVRPLDLVAWELPAALVESVTMWTDENGLDCYTIEVQP